MKKTSASVVLFLLVAALIAGCAGTGAPEPLPLPSQTPSQNPTATVVQPTTTPFAEINVDPASLKGRQIQFMHPWNGETALEMAKLIDEFNQTNSWGIHMIAQTPGSEGMLINQLTEDLATGNQPALAAISVDALLKGADAETRMIDLNPYLYSKDWGLSPGILNDLNPVYLEQDQVGGYQYGIPAERTAVMMFYNISWAKELGFSTTPVSPTEFQDQICSAAKELMKDDDPANDGLGGWIISTDGLVTYSWLTALNAPVFASGQFTFDTPQVQEAFRYMHNLLTSNCAWNPRLPAPYDYFARRQALVYSGYLQDILPQMDAFSRNSNSDEWTLIPFPSDQKQQVVIEGPSYAILKTTPEDQLAAWLFIRWMSEPAQQIRFVQASETLPLSSGVKDQLLDSGAMTQPWKDAIASAGIPVVVPSDRFWTLARTILEDSSWQLYKTNLTDSGIPALLAEMDRTFVELKDRQP